MTEEESQALNWLTGELTRALQPLDGQTLSKKNMDHGKELMRTHLEKLRRGFQLELPSAPELAGDCLGTVYLVVGEEHKSWASSRIGCSRKLYRVTDPDLHVFWLWALDRLDALEVLCKSHGVSMDELYELGGVDFEVIPERLAADIPIFDEEMGSTTQRISMLDCLDACDREQSHCLASSIW